jgi:hypothetical protein
MKLQSLVRTLTFGAALSASSLFANSVIITSTGNDGGLSAGEFLAKSDIGDFLTFCLEKQVHVITGVEYSYTIDPNALSGGPNLLAEPGDTISQGTAALYLAFRDGTLGDGFDGTGSYFDNRYSNAGLLQLAFWALEDEAVASQANNFYYKAAQTWFGGNAKANYTGDEVSVMNLWDVRGNDVQSVLFSPVPDGATTSVLLGLGLLGLAAFRRKL